MAKLDYHYKLPGRSIPAVRERFDDALNAHQRGRSMLFSGRKLSAEAFVNAIVLSFLDKTFDAQRAILAEYVPRFQALLGEQVELSGEAEKPPTRVGKKSVQGKPEGIERPKRKGG